MPIYEFQCGNCGHKDEKYVKRIFQRPRMMCSKCGKWMKRTFSQVNATMNGYPHWSGSMGVNVSQIPEYKKYYPGAVFNKRGDILVKSRNHKKEIMRRRGLVELE